MYIIIGILNYGYQDSNVIMYTYSKQEARILLWELMNNPNGPYYNYQWVLYKAQQVPI